MTTTDVKLCDANFSSFHWEKDDVGPERFVVTIDGKSESHCKQIKQQILENQEKAVKYDDLMDANHEIVENNIFHTQIHQENKQLKEKLEQIKRYYQHQKDTGLNLTGLEKILMVDHSGGSQK